MTLCVQEWQFRTQFCRNFLFVRHTIVRQMAQPGLRGQGWVVSVSVGPSGVCVKTLNEILKSIVVTDHVHVWDILKLSSGEIKLKLINSNCYEEATDKGWFSILNTISMAVHFVVL